MNSGMLLNETYWALDISNMPQNAVGNSLGLCISIGMVPMDLSAIKQTLEVSLLNAYVIPKQRNWGLVKEHALDYVGIPNMMCISIRHVC